MAVLTGESDPDERGRLWRRAKFVFATPQAVLNDAREGRVDFRDVVLLVFDEAQRSVSDYAYTRVARIYRDQAWAPLILGLTASPGGSRERVEEIEKNLFIERVEARSEEDRGVSPYVSPVSIESVPITLPERYRALLGALEPLFAERTKALAEGGFLPSGRPSKTALLRARGPMVSRLKASGEGAGGRTSRLLVDQAQAVTIMHAVETLGTQGVQTLLKYLRRLRAAPTPATSALLEDPRWVSIEKAGARLASRGYPKLDALVRVVKGELASRADSRVIVFAQYRDTIDVIVETLRASKVEGARFVGQKRKKGDRGMSQRTQSEVLERFRAGRFRVLVSSSIGEEGIDVPDVDLVVFYEAIPSEIRSIQRRGRTGRTRPGRVVVLLARGTVDEANYRLSSEREVGMRRLMSPPSGS